VARPVHDGLVGDRALVGTPYLADPALRAEYERDIAPRTEAALARVLAESLGPAKRTGPAVRAIDLGSGTGAAGRALHGYFGPRLSLVEVDRLVRAPDTIRADLSREIPDVDGRFDVVVAAHLLNELYVGEAAATRVERRAARVRAWARALLARGGALILIEPALRETSRELLAVRDVLVASGMEVVAPCFWRGPCPALVRPRDWCHDTASSPAGARVDFSYLVLHDGGTSHAEDSSLYRVVSDPMPEKGRLRLYGCGTDGRHALVRLDRNASPANAALDAARRGDVIRVERTQLGGDGLRINAETAVSRPNQI